MAVDSKLIGIVLGGLALIVALVLATRESSEPACEKKYIYEH